jgi:hypothetical protein
MGLCLSKAVAIGSVAEGAIVPLTIKEILY